MEKNIKSGRGVRQGDILLPNLFNCIIEEIFRNLNWENEGMKINSEYFNNLRYAHDVVTNCREHRKTENYTQFERSLGALEYSDEKVACISITQ